MMNFAFYCTNNPPHFCTVKESSFIHYRLMSRYIFIFALLLAAQFSYGQGWERIYTGGAQDEANDVEITPDGGYILAGFYGGDDVNLIKVDVDGFLQWSKFAFIGGPAQATGIELGSDSSYYVCGWRGAANNRNGLLFKTDFAGNLLWTKNLGVAGEDVFNDLVILNNGNVALVGHSALEEQLRVVMTNKDGDQLWAKSIGTTDFNEAGYDIIVANNGDIVVAGSRRKNANIKDVYIVRLNASNGDVIWEQNYSVASNTEEDGFGICQTHDGHFVVTGGVLVQGAPSNPLRGFVMKIKSDGDQVPLWFKSFEGMAEMLNDVEYVSQDSSLIITGRTPEVAGVKNDLFIAHLDSNGNFIWKNQAGKSGLTEGFAVSRSSDGGFVAVGYAATSSSPFQSSRYAYMVRTDAQGQIFTNYLAGQLYNDANNDCLPQNNEAPLKDWLIRVSSPDFTRFATTDNNGNYQIMVDTGVYELRVFPPNNYWSNCAGATQTVTVASFFDTITTNVGMRKDELCPYNEVDIQTPILRRCANNTYTVRYCNSGTAPSPDTKVLVIKSPELSIVSATQPFTQQGDSLFFSVGGVASGNCGDFEIVAFLDCNVDLTSAHCMSAHITPDEYCGTSSNWDGAIIRADAKCVDGKVQLSLKNIGTGVNNDAIEYVIVEEIIVLFVPPNSSAPISGAVSQLLPSGPDSLVFETPANGKTYRIIGEQTDGYPGMSVPTAAIEGCKTDTTSQVSTGFYTMFPEDDAEPFRATDCQEAYETNFNPDFLKRGHPKGYQEPHYIKPETGIDYLIHFQNTGSDTVHQVIVRDTLSPWLDPASVRPGTASHPYTYTVYGGGIVQFTLLNINLLPSGSSNSDGYVKFRVSQKPNLTCETEILNRAAIWYDFNAPVLTNETWHTVCDTFYEVSVQTTNIHFPGAGLKVYPNPFVEQATFEVTGVQANTFFLEVIDLQGRSVFNQTTTDSKFQLHGHQLPTGVLFYRLAADGKPVASGTMLRH
jgi:hypothetical protein